MRIDSLKVENFRCYESADFRFNPHFNLIIGVNGIGKTSLLKSVAAVLTSVSNALKCHIEIKDEDVRSVVTTVDSKLRFERSYPVNLQAQGEAFGIDQWSAIKERGNSLNPHDHQLSTSVQNVFWNTDASTYIDLPVLAFYQANRRWIPGQVSVMAAATDRPSRMDGYSQWWDAAANTENFERWVISKTLERLQKIAEGVNINSAREDEISLVNGAIKHALPQAVGLRYDMTLRSLMVDLENQPSLPFNSLSDGQRALIALLSDIARRMCLLNPHLGAEVLNRTKGIIIIDELDIHLHPAWQRSLVKALRSAFPSVQFIAASHSPQIIGTLKPEEVIILDQGESSHPRVTYGLDSSTILSEVMEADQRDPEIQRLLSSLFTSIEKGELETAKEQLSDLKTKAPDLPEFVGAEALIRRKEILGK